VCRWTAQVKINAAKLPATHAMLARIAQRMREQHTCA
jgi:hypothetical protein